MPRWLVLAILPRRVLIFALVGVLGGVLLLVLGSGPGADVGGLLAGLTGVGLVVELATPHRPIIGAVTYLAFAVLLFLGVAGTGVAAWAGAPESSPVVLAVGAVALAVLVYVWPTWWAAGFIPYPELRKLVAAEHRAGETFSRQWPWW